MLFNEDHDDLLLAEEGDAHLQGDEAVWRHWEDGDWKLQRSQEEVDLSKQLDQYYAESTDSKGEYQ